MLLSLTETGCRCSRPGNSTNYRLAVISVNRTGGSSTVTGTGPDTRPDGRRDPWLRTAPSGATMLPPPGQPGHGGTAYVRRQPVHILDGRFEGGYTDVFEVICPSCGDHPYLDYSEVAPRLQWLRGPRTLQAALAAYYKHVGLLAPPASAAPQSSDNGDA